MWYNMNRLDKVSYIHGGQQGGRAFLKTPSSGRLVYDKVPVCFQCGKRGHKRPDCPNKIAKIQIPTGSSYPRVEGKVGKVPCSMLVDTGSEESLVSAELVQSAVPGENHPIDRF